MLLCAPLAALAGWGDFEGEFDNDKAWTELQTQLPPYPKLEEAIPVVVSSATDSAFFIDPKSVSVGEDDVVRYTLIVKSAEGALNVSFEGIRCGSQEYKLYAFGKTDGTWARNRSGKWTPIVYKDRNRQHTVLYDDFFCPHGIAAKDQDDVVYALKRGIHPRAER
jgi:hypothetical protein